MRQLRFCALLYHLHYYCSYVSEQLFPKHICQAERHSYFQHPTSMVLENPLIPSNIVRLRQTSYFLLPTLKNTSEAGITQSLQLQYMIPKTGLT